MNEKIVGVVSMIGAIVFQGGGMHYWECEEVATRSKFVCRVRKKCFGCVVNFSIH